MELDHSFRVVEDGEVHDVRIGRVRVQTVLDGTGIQSFAKVVDQLSSGKGTVELVEMMDPSSLETGISSLKLMWLNVLTVKIPVAGLPEWMEVRLGVVNARAYWFVRMGRKSAIYLEREHVDFFKEYLRVNV